jgi:hypothetical protein
MTTMVRTMTLGVIHGLPLQMIAFESVEAIIDPN